MKEVYFANFWPQIITQRGLLLLEQKGFHVSGNWLNGSKIFNSSDILIYAYADFGKNIITAENIIKNKPERGFFSYILFPDSMIGWDYKKKAYLCRKNNRVQKILDTSNHIFSHSKFSLALVESVYNPIIKPFSVISLGVDTVGIQRYKSNRRKDKLKVLWNHEWRSDKGVVDAFNIIIDLANKYPYVDFIIGQEDNWGRGPDINDTKEICLPLVSNLNTMHNVIFQNKMDNQEQYWEFLSTVDIGFSTSYHEGFGLSMMEQEASGIACITPSEQVYPELHQGCKIVGRNRLKEGIGTLIENSYERDLVAKSCINNSLKYDTSIWVESLLNFLN